MYFFTLTSDYYKRVNIVPYFDSGETLLILNLLLVTIKRTALNIVVFHNRRYEVCKPEHEPWGKFQIAERYLM